MLYSMRFKLVLLTVCIFVAATCVSCRRTSTPVDKATLAKILLLGNGSEPQDLDPQVCTGLADYNVLIALFEGLTCIDEKTSQAVPGVAEHWNISADGRVYTFHLRASARWSNGDNVTAYDFAYAIKRALSPQLACEYSYLLFPLLNAEAYTTGALKDFSAVGVKVLDAQTLELTLGRPCPYLPTLVAHQVWYPVHEKTLVKFDAFNKRGTAWTKPENFVGNGPFVLKTWEPNSRITVARNPLYWDNTHNHLNGVVFYPNDNIATDEANFRSGQLHITWDLLPDRLIHYRKEAPYLLRVDSLSDSSFLRFNVTKAPLNDSRIRRALSLAIDREAIARDVLYQSRTAAYALTPLHTGGYSPKPEAVTDILLAKQLLKEAGYPEGKGFPVLELQMNTDAINTKIFEAVQEMWRHTLGIKINLANLDFRIWLDNQRTLSYQISRSRWVGDFDDPSTYIDLFLSDSGNNRTGWVDPQFDLLDKKANETLDPKTRFSLLQEAESRLLKEAPIAPVFYGTKTYLISPAVHNWQSSLLGIHRYQFVDLISP
ncbi:MAG: peptide ABC transporter substrate-binding protein [Verrucomicrobia bacterium]|nr:MAG: peptide ABC transporter substrate-binding protein [Verrucomicrobiota bacterium]